MTYAVSVQDTPRCDPVVSEFDDLDEAQQFFQDAQDGDHDLRIVDFTQDGVFVDTWIGPALEVHVAMKLAGLL